MSETGTVRVKRGLAEMLRGGVIMDVVDAEQAKIAEDAGAVAVMALERVPADIRRDGGVARMSDPSMIEGIQEAVTDPGDGQVPHRPLRRGAGAPGARRRLRRRVRGAHPGRRGAPRRQVGVHGAVRVRRDQPRRGAAAHLRGRGHDPLARARPAPATSSRPSATCARSSATSSGSPGPTRRSSTRWAKELRAPVDLVQEVAERGELPVPLFCAGGIATPADAALVMQLGAQSVFVGCGIFKCDDPSKRGQGDRRGHHALRRRRHRRQGVARARRGDAAARRSTTLDVKLAERGW